MSYFYPFCWQFRTGFTFSGAQKCILCILVCRQNDKSFTVISLFAVLMIGKQYYIYCVHSFMHNTEFLFSSFSSQQAIDSEIKAEVVPSVTVKVLCLTQTIVNNSGKSCKTWSVFCVLHLNYENE